VWLRELTLISNFFDEVRRRLSDATPLAVRAIPETEAD
jgi:hypothetical protein